ncbi:hypothetical protein ACP70R_047392 [Stipagrostis hirtigluma subsp. patula]
MAKGGSSSGGAATAAAVALVAAMAALLCAPAAAAGLARLEHPAKDDGTLSLLVVGDWGRNGTYNQSRVAEQGKGDDGYQASFWEEQTMYAHVFVLSREAGEASAKG